MRSIVELVDVDDPGWPVVTEALAEVDHVVLPPDSEACRATLLQLQVTARSLLGAVTLNSGGLEKYYADMFWPGWQTEVAALGLRDAITMWPPLFSKEGAENVAGTTRSAVPLRDQLSFQVDFAGQFGLAAPGPLGEV